MAHSISASGISALGIGVFALSMGCSEVSQLTQEQVARSETTVMQTQQALGSSESGAIELQLARDHLAQAKQAVEKDEDKKAQRYARYAQLDAELAVAKAQSAAARKAADELLASIDTLRQEAQRTTVVPH